MKIFDANHILRLILHDNAEMAEQAENLIDVYTIYVPYAVLAEVCYVLTKVYSVERQETVRVMSDFVSIDHVKTDNRNLSLRCLEIYGKSSLDFVDCLLCAYHTELGYEICTFDKKMLRMMKRLDEDNTG